MKYIGKGTYTIPEVQYLTGISSKKITRWTNGYTYKKNNSIYQSNPIYKSEYLDTENKAYLSFLDLIEILFIDSFEKHGLSLQSIRKAADSASRLINTSHPFAKKIFYTDGKTILAEIAKENNDPELIDLLRKQYQMDSIIAPSLIASLDFNQLDLAEKWWPLGKNNRVVVDPSRNFGKPIIDNLNIRVATIVDLYNRNKSINEISNWYDIDEISINAALEFNRRAIA